MLLDFGNRAAQVEKEWFRAEKRKKKTGNISKIRIKCFPPSAIILKEICGRMEKEFAELFFFFDNFKRFPAKIFIAISNETLMLNVY